MLTGSLDIVKYLVEECKVDPNIKNGYYVWAPLYAASNKGWPEIVKYLKYIRNEMLLRSYF